MSSQDSWSCLSVQEFLSLGNWQGQLRENCNGQQQQALTLTHWQCLSVQEFFSLTNWQGQLRENRNDHYQDQFLQLTLQAEAAIASRLNSWQCLSVQEFFRLTNWQGQLQENYNWHSIDQSSRLTLQVQDFFEFMSWEGNPEIGSLPKASSLPDLVTPIKTTLTDLSTLF